MKGLQIKDFKLIKTQKLFIVIITAICGYLLAIGKMEFAMIYSAIIFSMLVVSTVNYDDQDNGMGYLFTLPVSRKGYVLEKYVFGILLMGLALTVGSILLAILSIVKSAAYTSEDLFDAVWGFWVTGSFILSATLPFQIKYGAEKGRIALAITILCVGVAGYVIQEAVKAFDIDISAFAEPLLHASAIQTAVLLTVLIVVMLGISYLISVSFMKKRQF